MKSNKTVVKLLTGALVIGGFAFSGVGGLNQASASKYESKYEYDYDDDYEYANLQMTPKISLVEAVNAALAKVTNGVFVDAELDYDRNNALVYEVNLLGKVDKKKVVVKVDATTGDILTVKTSKKKEKNAQTVTPTITLEEAIKTALTKADGTVEEVELKNKRNKLTYEIEILNTTDYSKTEVKVDAKTGAVLSVKLDD